jgi:hypothetical protein
MSSSGMLRRVALVRTDVSEELSASFIRVTRILCISSQLASVVSYSWWMRRSFPRNCRVLQDPHGVTSQKTPFFKVLHISTCLQIFNLWVNSWKSNVSFLEVLVHFLFRQCCLQARQTWAGVAPSILTTDTNARRKFLMMKSILDTKSSWRLMGAYGILVIAC